MTDEVARLRAALTEALDIAEEAEACCDSQFRISSDPPCENCAALERLRSVLESKSTALPVTISEVTRDEG